MTRITDVSLRADQNSKRLLGSLLKTIIVYCHNPNAGVAIAQRITQSSQLQTPCLTAHRMMLSKSLTSSKRWHPDGETEPLRLSDKAQFHQETFVAPLPEVE